MTWCPEIDHNVSVHYTNQNVLVGPCCQAHHTPASGSILNHNRLVELRKLNHSDQPLAPDCRACSLVEESGGISRRQSQLKFYHNWKKPGIRSLDLHLGNLCNLKCVICSPENSTSWISDAKKLKLTVKDHWLYNKHDQFDIAPLSELPDLEMIHFWGGEPLASDAHVKFLQALKDNKRLEHCRINYNTNGTFIPSADALDLWKEAKLVELYFSVDDVNQRFEYQRTNASWDEVIKNLDWYYNIPITNHLYYFTTTWSLLNLYYLPEVVDWKKRTLDTNRFGDHVQHMFNRAQGFCEVTELNSRAFKHLETKFKPYKELNFILEAIVVNDNYRPTIFFDYIKKLDLVRNSSYKAVHSEWANILEI